MNDFLSADEINRILELRAQKASRVAQSDEHDRVYSRVAIVGLGNARFGIPLENLTLIVKKPPIAVLPQMPPNIRGLVQIRGELIGVVDVARWFGIASGQQEYLAVVEEQGGRLGLIIDKVLGFKDISYSDLAEGIDDDTIETGHPIEATTKDLISLFNIKRLFSSSEVKADFSTKQR